MKSKFCELQKELSETKEVKSQLERLKWRGTRAQKFEVLYIPLKEIFELLFPLILQRCR